MKKAKKEVPAQAETATIKTKKVKSSVLKKLKANSDAKAAEEKPKKAKGEKKAKKEKGERTERKVMYKYPKEMTDPVEKKNFRAKCRKALKGFDRSLKLIAKGKSKKTKAGVEKEMAAFKKEHFNEEA